MLQKSKNKIFIVEKLNPEILFIQEKSILHTNKISEPKKSRGKLERSKSMFIDSVLARNPVENSKTKTKNEAKKDKDRNQGTVVIHPWLKKKVEKDFLIGKQKIKYIGYEFHQKLKINDCLHLAESFSAHVNQYHGSKSMMKEEQTNLLFGFSYVRNQKIVENKKTNLNNKANPSVGQAYAIVEKELEDGVPYHIAYVLYKDGSTNITIEADAGNVALIKPIFNIYETANTSKATFHNRYKNNFTDPVTIVLVPR